MIDLNNTVFLVDGKTEIKALRDKFSKEYGIFPDVRKTGCNGKGVTPEGYVSASIGTLKLVLRNRYRHIICIIDRESRAISARKLADKIRITIVEQVSNNLIFRRDDIENKLIVCIPDRMFENWIIADIKGIQVHSDLIDSSSKQKPFDGTNGIGILQKIMKVSYKKTIHGPKLFKSISFNRAKNNSPSFENFFSAIIT